MKRKINKKLVVTICIILLGSSIVLLDGGQYKAADDSSIKDAQSTTGPYPPENYDKGLDPAFITNPVVITEVPSYIWHHGCGPTAAGMVIGYWDIIGFDDLVVGDASSQTNEVDEAIATEGDGDGTTSNPGTPGTGHVPDYGLYEGVDDSYHTTPYPDMSEPDIYGEHASNSIADFMETSWSFRNNKYGWSWYSDVDNALEDYSTWANPSYQPSATNNGWSQYLWDNYCAEIDAGRPVVLLVDTNGDGSTDHFITAIGYDSSGNYACYNTWNHNIHWYDFTHMSQGNPWGIYGATFFDLDVIYYPPVAEFTFSPINPAPGETITFDASASYDPDGVIVGYYWSYLTVGVPHFPHGMGTGEIIEYEFRAGIYRVMLRVVDDDGLQDITEQYVIVEGET